MYLRECLITVFSLRKEIQPFSLIILSKDWNSWKLNYSARFKFFVRCFETGIWVSEKLWINTCQICSYLISVRLLLLFIEQTWFDPTGGKAELCGYCLDITVTLGKLAFLCNPRDGKATKGKQIGLEGKGMAVVNPFLKVATFVSSAVPYSESWSLYTSFLACPGDGSKPEF